MNSWEIIKQEVTKGREPDTLYYSVAINLGGQIFIGLQHHLKDWKKAAAAFNTDAEVAKALTALPLIRELRTCGYKL